MSTRPDFAYHPYFCEENIWHLLQHPRLAGHERRAIWVTAAAGHCPIWRQRAAEEEAECEPIFWDYHVLAIARERGLA